MNILVITQLYPEPDDIGGYKITHTVEYFCKEWVELGHSVFVFHCPSKFPLFFYLIPKTIKERYVKGTYRIIPSVHSRRQLDYKKNGIHICRLPILKMYPGNGYSSKRLRRVSKRIEAILFKNGFTPDLVLGHFANPSTEIVANISDFYNCPSSIVFHNDCTKDSIKKYRLKDAVSRIGSIGCRSLVESNNVFQLLSLDRVPFVCYSGVPNDAIDGAETVCNKHDYTQGISFLYVGGLIKNKNVDSVIKAFARHHKNNDWLQIIGAGTEERYLKELSEEFGVSNSVYFAGRMPRENVLDNMKRAHVFSMISNNETYGMVYMEAMLQGCIVVASKGGGFDGIIIDGVNGFLCNPGDDEMLGSIFEKINNLSVTQRNMIGQSAIETARNFSEQQVAKDYLDEIIKRNERR